MTTETHTMAGHLAAAGAARLGIGASGSCLTGAPHSAGHAIGVHPSTTWTQGTFATSSTYMVLDRKNRPTRPLSELSP